MVSCKVNGVPYHSKTFIISPVLAVRPFSVTDNLQGSYRTILLGELLGEYHKIETVKTFNINISAYQAIIRSSMKLRSSPSKY